MIVFVEGVDGSGKTTLVKKLNEMIGFPIAVPPQRNDNKDKELQDWYTFIYDSRKSIYVCDRSIISEVVYRLNDTQDTFLDIQRIAGLLNTECKFIYCISLSSFTDAKERGEDNIVTYEQHSNIQRTYDLIMHIIQRFSDIPIMTYDWHVDSIDKVSKFILQQEEVKNGI